MSENLILIELETLLSSKHLQQEAYLANLHRLLNQEAYLVHLHLVRLVSSITFGSYFILITLRVHSSSIWWIWSGSTITSFWRTSTRYVLPSLSTDNI